MAKRVGTAVRLAKYSTIEILDKRKAVLHLISTIESSTIESSPSTISTLAARVGHCAGNNVIGFNPAMKR
ncbi:hypothetical protein V6Z12_A11G099800 [Gossypium hirsutum]|uniref:Uncharacterized protein n=2 Tax=Gossypium TaxID=3633 RepID=A0A5D2NBU3_GOSTO|nr:hypothetical protein ES288_A11G102800v1 [Gossypium darwinii]TYH99979.1 hypothetical protein ES332_A11G102100v1 [Gossypium tomentosum]